MSILNQLGEPSEEPAACEKAWWYICGSVEDVQGKNELCIMQ